MPSVARWLGADFLIVDALTRKRRTLGQQSAWARAVPSGVPRTISFEGIGWPTPS